MIQWGQPPHIILHVWLQAWEAQDHKEPGKRSGVSANGGTIFIKRGAQLWNEGFDHRHEITGAVLLSEEQRTRQDSHCQLTTQMARQSAAVHQLSEGIERQAPIDVIGDCHWDTRRIEQELM